MQNLGNMELQKGKFSMLFGHWDQILSGALDVDVECCEQCKKLEFYLLGDADTPETSGIQQIACPYCGDMHDMDDAICPHCGRRLNSRGRDRDIKSAHHQNAGGSGGAASEEA